MGKDQFTQRMDSAESRIVRKSELGDVGEQIAEGDGSGEDKGRKRAVGSRDYNPDKVFAPIKASDVHGRAVMLSTKVHPRVERLLGLIIEQRIFPIPDRSSFVRMAVHGMIDMLAGLDPTVPSIMARIGGIAQLCEEDRIATEFDEHLEAIGRQVRGHLDKGRRELAVKLVEGVKAEIEMMPETEWKRIWVKTMKDRFGDMLDEDKEKKEKRK